jgi:hypothetical protein
MANKYRKKPIEIEAIQYLGHFSDEIKDFVNGNNVVFDPSKGIKIATLEGVMTAVPGDWIIRGVKGELYPCKPDIFKESYEEISGE